MVDNDNSPKDDNEKSIKKDIFSNKDIIEQGTTVINPDFKEYGDTVDEKTQRLNLIKEKIKEEKFSELSLYNIHEILEINVDESDILNNVENNEEVISFLKNKIHYASRETSKKILKNLLEINFLFKLEEVNPKCAKILNFNKAMFELDSLTQKHVFNEEILKKIMLELFDFINKKYKELDEPEEKIFKLDKFSTYENIYQKFCAEGNKIKFYYDFEKPDLEIKTLDTEYLGVQRCILNINSESLVIPFPLRYEMHCFQCKTNISVMAYEVRNLKEKVRCEGTKRTLGKDGKMYPRVCGASLYPHGSLMQSIDVNYYDVIKYKDTEEREKFISGMSFKELNVGENDAIIIINHIGNKIFMFILDTKKIDAKTFEIKDIVSENVLQSNKVFSIIKSCDEFIENNAYKKILGLYPIKAAFIFQAASSYIEGFPHNFNIQLLGDKSTGKSMMTKYYGYLLNMDGNYMTRANDISVPALRGTRALVNVFGKDVSYITKGLLSRYRLINIDEISLNTEKLMENLKTFLCEENYSYDKAGSTGVSCERTAHINTTENVGIKHLGEYCGRIRKTYKEISLMIGGDVKDPWDEKWDLHKPLVEYNNPYLYKAIKDTRDYFYNKQQSWIDGYDLALHDRFPFYFYLNTSSDFRIFENFDANEKDKDIGMKNNSILNSLRNETIQRYFNECKKYKNPITKIDNKKMLSIYKEYEINPDFREHEFYVNLLILSRMINQRFEYNDSDYEFIKYMIENTNRKLYVSETMEISLMKNRKEKTEKSIMHDNSKIGIFSNVGIAGFNREKMIAEVESVRNSEDGFSLPEGEF